MTWWKTRGHSKKPPEIRGPWYFGGLAGPTTTDTDFSLRRIHCGSRVNALTSPYAFAVTRGGRRQYEAAPDGRGGRCRHPRSHRDVLVSVGRTAAGAASAATADQHRGREARHDRRMDRHAGEADRARVDQGRRRPPRCVSGGDRAHGPLYRRTADRHERRTRQPERD